MLADIKEKMTALSPISVTETDYAVKGYHLDVTLAAEQIIDATNILDEALFTLEAVTGVDWLGEYNDTLADIAKKKAAAAKAAAKAAEDAAKAAAEGGEGAEAATPPPPPVEEPEVSADLKPEMEVVYDFSHTDHRCRVVLRCRFDRAEPPEIPTISKIYPGANWHERETHDFYGIKFAGHPDLSPLLLPEDADFHPLLKDYTHE